MDSTEEGSRPGPPVSRGAAEGLACSPPLSGLPLKSPTEKSCFEKLTAQCGDRAVCFNSRKTRPQSGSRRRLRQLNKQPRSRFQAPCSLASRCWRPLKAERGAVALRGDGGGPPSQLPGPQRTPLSGGQRGGRVGAPDGTSRPSLPGPALPLLPGTFCTGLPLPGLRMSNGGTDRNTPSVVRQTGSGRQR